MSYRQARRPLERTTSQYRPVGFRPITPITFSLTYCLQTTDWFTTDVSLGKVHSKLHVILVAVFSLSFGILSTGKKKGCIEGLYLSTLFVCLFVSKYLGHRRVCMCVWVGACVPATFLTVFNKHVSVKLRQGIPGTKEEENQKT